ncbi:phosphomethylpyrimidine synthase ThiC [Desulforhabdus amnigena]|uniref:Phosphomethylpyrimidine synthase n=1 Tax=Desulforhabdus amnigena TaxID=40218 RepID=A0A9W6FV12_9BACT|nr:phosphomethylpyrimidine synthase ThiC [Desulforhabdus amnigena]NLJ28820.1 phosphomethylpyrimidine synthase ThiC [Deltaproteobacteria bacterium]GLI35363.1 phosphomethylpyrimidine synthase [Desulforhabdus amnigena]
MPTQLDYAKDGVVTEEMKQAVIGEPITAEELRERIAQGHAVLPKNINHSFPILRAIGRGLKTKVNANLGSSGECYMMDLEDAKLKAALKAKTDSIMDLSTGGNLGGLRQYFLEHSTVMVGAVPIYALATEMVCNHQPLDKMDGDQLLKSIEKQCREGLDYITVHCGVTLASVKKLESFERIMPCVSRGGSIHMHWMRANRKENPLYENFDDLLEIAHKYDVTLSLGDGFRPGTIMDATDGAQLEELMILGELAKRARARGVQTMIEGPGHVPFHQIQANMQLQKKLCDGAPFYILGPLPTDIAAGYDHITAAIGGALAGSAGADFICYVTPAEHLGLPNADDVYQGVMASRIAAHVADIAKGLPGAMDADRRISEARQKLDWEGVIRESLDPDLVRERIQITEDREACSMCGKLCAVKISRLI